MGQLLLSLASALEAPVCTGSGGSGSSGASSSSGSSGNGNTSLQKPLALQHSMDGQELQQLLEGLRWAAREVCSGTLSSTSSSSSRAMIDTLDYMADTLYGLQCLRGGLDVMVQALALGSTGGRSSGVSSSDVSSSGGSALGAKQVSWTTELHMQLLQTALQLLEAGTATGRQFWCAVSVAMFGTDTRVSACMARMGALSAALQLVRSLLAPTMAPVSRVVCGCGREAMCGQG